MGRFLFVFCALCLGLSSGMVAAQVTVEARLGFQGTVRLEKWNPVHVQVYNAGAPLAGTLSVRVWRGSEFRKDLHATTFTQPVELPYRSRKRFTFVVPITSITHPVEVSLRQEEQVLVHQRLDLREALNAEHLLLGITSDPSLDFLATNFQQHTRVVYVQPRALPQHWSGYDTISAAVLKGVSLQAMSEKQLVALRQWIARGGTLVVAGDSQYGLLQEARTGDLLPVQVLGVEQRHGLPELAEHYGEPLPAAPLLALRARLVHGQVLVGTAAMPLLAQRGFGKGRVVFLAVDYAMQPLAGWAGNEKLWKDILQPVEDIDFNRVFAELGLLDDAHPMVKLLRRPLLTYPTHLALSGFLLAYCGGLGVVFWRMGKARGGRRRYWLSVLVLLALATGVAYHLFPERHLRQAAMVIDMSVAEVLADSGYSHTHGYLGLFSPRGGQYGLVFNQPETILRHTFHRGSGHAGAMLELATTDSLLLRGIRLDPWMLRVFSVENMAPAPLQVRTWRHAAGVTVQLANRGTLPLHGAVLGYRGMLFPLGTVEPGKELFEDLYAALQPKEHTHEVIWQALFKRRPPDSDARMTYLQETVLRHAFGEERLVEIADTPLLVGWFMAPTTLQQTPGLPVRGVTLVISRLPG